MPSNPFSLDSKGLEALNWALHIDTPYCLLDRQGYLHWRNPTLERLLAPFLGKEELRATTLQTWLRAAPKHVGDRWQAALDAPPPFDLRLEIPGHHAICALHGSPFRPYPNQAAEAELFITSCTLISERPDHPDGIPPRYEYALSALAKQLGKEIPMLILSQERTIKYASPGWQNSAFTFGTEWLDTPFIHFVPVASQAQVLDFLDNIQQGLQSDSALMEVQKQEGKTELMRVQGILVPETEEVCLVFTTIPQQKDFSGLHQAQQDMLIAAGNAANVGGWSYDLRTQEIYWTPQTYHIKEVPLDYEVTFERAMSFFPEPGRSQLVAAVQCTIQDAQPYDLELPFVSAKGTKRQVRAIGNPVMEGGKVVQLTGIILDISEQKATEQLLKQQRDLLELSEELAGFSSYIGDLSTLSYKGSNNFAPLLGLPEKPSYPFAEINAHLHPEDRNKARQLFESSGQMHKTAKQLIRFYKPDGTLLHLYNHTVVYYDEWGNPSKIVGVLQDATEETLIKQKLKRATDLLAQGEQIARLGSFDLDISTLTYTVSDNFIAILGLQPQPSYSFEQFWMLIHPEDQLAVDQKHQDAAKIGGSYETEFRCIKPNGDQIAIHMQANISLDETGIPVRKVGYIQDVTEKKATERRIRESEARLRLLTENMDEVFWLRSADNSHILYVNSAYERVWGRSIESLIADPNSFFEAMHPEDKGQLIEAAQSYSETGIYNEEHRVVHPDGSVRWVWSKQQAVTDDKGQVLSHVGISTDITDRKAQEEKLSLLQSAVENGKDAVVITLASPIEKEEGGPEIVYVNEAFTQMTGYTQEEILGRTPRVLQGPDTSREELDRIHRAMQNWESLHTELLNYKKDGTPFWANCIITPIANDQGCFTHWVSIQRDVTERKQQEFELIQTKEQAELASRAKTDFLSTMSHEIRTPLNAVIGMTGLLQDTALNPEQESYVRVIRQGGENLLSVINDILDFNKIEAGQMDLEQDFFPLLLPMEEAMEMLAGAAHAKGLELIFLPSMGLPKVIGGDITRLRQVLVNLINNAIKFTDQGHIILEAKVAEKYAEETLLEFRVIDTGVGIPPEKRDRLFKSFSQVDASIKRRYGGSGLGLAISQKLVHLNGGQIKVESTEGIGSTFAFTWKVKVQAESGAAICPPIIVQPFAILDPSVPLHDFYLGIGKFMEAQTLVSAQPDAFLTQIQSLHKPIVLIDTNVRTSEGESVWRVIRQRYPDIRMIWIGKGHMPTEWKHHFVGSISKPFRVQDYINQLVRAAHPTSIKPDLQVITRPPSEQLDLSAFRVLIVEDNLINLKVATRILEKYRLRIETAQNGQEALDYIQMGPFNLVLMDMQMPVMDGVTATRHIRAMKHIHQPLIIAMTANATQRDRTTCLQAGMDDFITKPIKVEVMKQHLKKWLLG